MQRSFCCCDLNLSGDNHVTTSRVEVSFSVMQLRLVVGKIIGIAGMSLLGTCVGVASFVGFVPMRFKSVRKKLRWDLLKVHLFQRV